MTIGSETSATVVTVGEGRLRWVTVLLAVTCGLSVANIYYSQPLLGELSSSFGVSSTTASMIVTFTQVGYGLGLVFIVPLGDLRENRRLATWLLMAAAVALVLAASAASFAASFAVFLVASLTVGVTSVVAQVLVPIAAHLAPEGRAGVVIGRVMSGLLLGILLARSASSLLAAVMGWRWVYLVSAVLMLILALVISRCLPTRRPTAQLGYPALIQSMLELVRTEPVLRRRAAYQALMFGSFSAFWTSIAFELHDRHHLGQVGIGIFALIGAGGAAAAPIAGWLGDRGQTHAASGLSFLLAAAAMTVSLSFGSSLALLAAAGFVLDLAVQTTLVLGQRAIYAANPASRARMNGAYLTFMFVGARSAQPRPARSITPTPGPASPPWPGHYRYSPYSDGPAPDTKAAPSKDRPA